MNMTNNRSSICLEQFSHLGLGEPDGFVFQADINLCLSVFTLIYDNFTIFHEKNC